jgi:hypothetical protein
MMTVAMVAMMATMFVPQSWNISTRRSRMSRSIRSRLLSMLSKRSVSRSSVHVVRSMLATLQKLGAKEAHCLQILRKTFVA